MATEGAVLKQAYTELAKADRSGDHERALKACNRIIKNRPKETLAFKCKLICLIQMGKFEEACQFIKKTAPNQMGADVRFERAYCEYRLNRSEEAVKTLTGTDINDYRCMELKAQLLYRMERFEEARQLYKNLLKDHTDGYDEERRTNYMAAEVHMTDQLNLDEQAENFDTYEQYYNSACRLIETNDYQKALSHLTIAEKMCKEMLVEEDATDEEIEDELAVIRTQMAFCYQSIGEIDLAASLYAQVQKQRPSDAVVSAVAGNNAVALKKDNPNLFEARKKLKSAQQIGANSKFSPRQKRTLALNQALLQLHSNQLEPCRRSLEQLRADFGLKVEALLIEASLLMRQKEGDKAVNLLRNFLKTNRDYGMTCPEISCAILQLQLNEGKTIDASALSSLPDSIRWRPGILSLLVAVYMTSKREQEAVRVLAEGVQMNRDDPTILSLLLNQSAILTEKLGDTKAAANYVEEMRRLQPKEPKLLARLIKLYSRLDTSKAESLAKELSNLDKNKNNRKSKKTTTEISENDLDRLESSEWILFGEKYRQKKETKQQLVTTPDSEGQSSALRSKQRKGRKRKIRLPKNYDPNVSPDPERWLPKQERQAYRKRKDKRHNKDRDVGRGTQGATDAGPIGKSPQIHESPKMASTTSTNPTQLGPRMQRPVGGQQAKKRKKKTTAKW